MKVYGITNCDTVKKALDWLRANKVDYEFHDFKKLGISNEKLKEWDKKAGYEKFLNKKSTTWKEVDPEVKETIKTSKDALKLLQEKTSMIKRPVIEKDGFLFFGFDECAYKQLLNYESAPKSNFLKKVKKSKKEDRIRSDITNDL